MLCFTHLYSYEANNNIVCHSQKFFPPYAPEKIKVRSCHYKSTFLKQSQLSDSCLSTSSIGAPFFQTFYGIYLQLLTISSPSFFPNVFRNILQNDPSKEALTFIPSPTNPILHPNIPYSLPFLLPPVSCYP